MNKKIIFKDGSALAISVSMAEEGKMATIAYNQLLGFIEDELLNHAGLSLKTKEVLTESEDDELSLDEFDEEEFEDEDMVEWDEERIDEDELEDEEWEDEDELEDEIL
jgi:hypothetical protein